MKFRWNWRILVSYFLLFSSLALLVSGIALFVAPSGRIARSTGWEFLGLDKEQWEEFHTVFGYLGALFGLFHLFLNWRCLVGYLKRRVRLIRLRPEFLLALLLAILVGIGAVLSWAPFQKLMELGESLKPGSGGPSAREDQGPAVGSLVSGIATPVRVLVRWEGAT